jgi:predicted nucleotide-binding protein
MVIQELQLLSEALWESVKTDLKFFSSIRSFVRKLAEFNYSELVKDDMKEIILYSNKIEEFFKEYRPIGNAIYFPPHQTDSNDETVKSIWQLTNQLANMPAEELQKEIEMIKPKSKSISSGQGFVFIGHGRSKLWARILVYLQDELGLKTLSFESESHTSETIINILDDMLNKASYAILVLTAEDETNDGKTRARQNVIHEPGLFQGRLGFNKVILLKQDKTDEFTNIAGLQYIPFNGDNIEQTFYELQRTFKKAGLLK